MHCCTIYQFFRVNTCSDSSVSVLPSCAHHQLRLLRTLKIPNQPFGKTGLTTNCKSDRYGECPKSTVNRAIKSKRSINEYVVNLLGWKAQVLPKCACCLPNSCGEALRIHRPSPFHRPTDAFFRAVSVTWAKHQAMWQEIDHMISTKPNHSLLWPIFVVCCVADFVFFSFSFWLFCYYFALPVCFHATDH